MLGSCWWGRGGGRALLAPLTGLSGCGNTSRGHSASGEPPGPRWLQTHAHAWRQWLFSVLSQTFGVLHATKHHGVLSQQESHRHSCDLRPNSIYLGRLLYVSKLQELTAVKAGVGCVLDRERAVSGAAEIIPSTPSGLPTAQQQAKHCLFRRKTQDYFFSTSSAESPMARCACEWFKRNVLRL